MEKITQEKFQSRTLSTLISVQKIVTVHYQQLTQKYRSVEEMHDFWELLYADRQSCTVVINGERHLLRKGEILLVPPNAPHYVESGEYEPNLFILSFICRSKRMEFFTRAPLPVPERYRYLLENIMTEADSMFVIPEFNPMMRRLELRDSVTPGSEQILKNTLELLLVYLLRSDSATPQKFLLSKEDSGSLESEIVRLLSQNLYEEFSLEMLCETLHYGKTYLCTFFREKTGKSIYSTYLGMKCSEAKRLIRKRQSLSEIAQILRFDSLPHFTRIFKRHTGMTPGEYRASIQTAK